MCKITWLCGESHEADLLDPSVSAGGNEASRTPTSSEHPRPLQSKHQNKATAITSGREGRWEPREMARSPRQGSGAAGAVLFHLHRSCHCSVSHSSCPTPGRMCWAPVLPPLLSLESLLPLFFPWNHPKVSSEPLTQHQLPLYPGEGSAQASYKAPQETAQAVPATVSQPQLLNKSHR